jgi:phosphate transport system substrate-binding protein
MHRLWFLGSIARCLVATLVAATLAGCGRKASEETSAHGLTLAIDPESASLAEGAVNAYETFNTNEPLSLQEAGRAQVLAALQAGEVNAALILHPTEDLDAELFHTVVGREMLVLAVHDSITIDSLSRGDARALFSGQQATWPEIAPPLTVTIIATEPGSSMRRALEDLILGEQKLASSARLATDSEEMLDLVRITPGAVALVERSDITTPIETLRYDGRQPTPANARRGRYTLTTTVEFVALEEPTGQVRAFLDWLLSEDGQAVVKRTMLGARE